MVTMYVRSYYLVPHVKDLAEPSGCEGEVVVGEHDALGSARGARGVDQVAALVDGHVAQPLVELVLLLFPAHLYEVLPTDDAVSRGFARVLHDCLESLEFGLEEGKGIKTQFE